MSVITHEGLDDAVLSFAVENLDIRGKVVRLCDNLNLILDRHAYPTPIARALGEALVLTALLGGILKDEGRFQLQTRTDGIISMIVVDYESMTPIENQPSAKMRAYARFDEKALSDHSKQHLTTAFLLGKGVLGLTIEQGTQQARYQGVVELNGQGFEEAAHQYFNQSEQIPTKIRLAVAETYETTEDGSTIHVFRAGGMMVQFLPMSVDRQRHVDLHPGDARSDIHAATLHDEDDLWMEATALTQTIEDHELVDPTMGSERLLYRLFHERGVKAYPALKLHELCRCSQERILNMLASFPADDVTAMRDDEGKIAITCEFCSRQYALSCEEVEAAIPKLVQV